MEENRWQDGIPHQEQEAQHETSASQNAAQSGRTEYTGAADNGGWQSPGGAYGGQERKFYPGGYQYNTSTGWQQSGPGREPPQQEYSWNFSEYEQVDPQPRRPHRSGGKIALAVLGCILAVGITGMAGYGIFSFVKNWNAFGTLEPPYSSSQEAAPSKDIPQLTLNDKPETGEQNRTDGTLTTKQIARAVRPSVVGIVQYQMNYPNGPAAQGSGIVMSADGYIITNAHVIEGADGISVVLDNGEIYEGRLIGSDVKTDLAVIKIEEDNLSYAEFGKSSELEIGDAVVAIGNPGGVEFAGSVTAGIISGLDRLITTDAGGTIRCIQTDAAINPGNSGGPLVNEFGQVIGINSSKIVYTGYEGLGFAIPMDEAQPVINDLMQYGYVKGRVKLGITGASVDPVRAQMFRYPLGVEINSIDPASDLYNRNVVSGDIITGLNDDTVGSMSELREALEKYKPGDVVELHLFRKNGNQMGGRSYSVTITLLEDTGSSKK